MTVYLTPPPALTGRRPRADEKDWQLRVREPGSPVLRVHYLYLGPDEVEEAQAQAAALLGGEVTWSPQGRSFKGEVAR